MSTVFFDISNIVRFALSNDRVTGIQRVQLRIISDLVALHGSEHIRGLAHLDRKGWADIDLNFLLHQSEFDAVDFLLKVGHIQPSRFPSQDQVKRRLAPLDRHKVRRGLKKAWIYLSALVSTRWARAQGYRIYSRADCAVAAHTPFRGFGPGDVFAILGENWSNSESEALAHRHHAADGRVVQMMHDLIPYAQPQLHTDRMVAVFNNWLSRTITDVACYLCVSAHTAKDLRTFASEKGALLPTVEVTPLAHEFHGHPRDAMGQLPDNLRDQPYVLCVGSLEVRKNGAGLLRAWQRVHTELGERTPLLVFAGKRGWKIGEFDQLLQTSPAAHTVRFVDSPSDAELVGLYRHCLFVAYPSLYEGWGLPVGEAAWFGKFGVVSDRTSVPEVCGDLMDAVDPEDDVGLADALLRPLTDSGYLSERTARVAAAPMRTWRDVAMDVYRHLRVQA